MTLTFTPCIFKWLFMFSEPAIVYNVKRLLLKLQYGWSAKFWVDIPSPHSHRGGHQLQGWLAVIIYKPVGAKSMRKQETDDTDNVNKPAVIRQINTRLTCLHPTPPGVINSRGDQQWVHTDANGGQCEGAGWILMCKCLKWKAISRHAFTPIPPRGGGHQLQGWPPGQLYYFSFLMCNLEAVRSRWSTIVAYTDVSRRATWSGSALEARHWAVYPAQEVHQALCSGTSSVQPLKALVGSQIRQLTPLGEVKRSLNPH